MYVQCVRFVSLYMHVQHIHLYIYIYEQLFASRVDIMYWLRIKVDEYHDPGHLGHGWNSHRQAGKVGWRPHVIPPVWHDISGALLQIKVYTYHVGTCRSM